jgi:hypothetical protein
MVPERHETQTWSGVHDGSNSTILIDIVGCNTWRHMAASYRSATSCCWEGLDCYTSLRISGGCNDSSRHAPGAFGATLGDVSVMNNVLAIWSSAHYCARQPSSTNTYAATIMWPHRLLGLALTRVVLSQLLAISGLYEGMTMHLEWNFGNVTDATGPWEIGLLGAEDANINHSIIDKRGNWGDHYWHLPSDLVKGTKVCFKIEGSECYVASPCDVEGHFACLTGAALRSVEHLGVIIDGTLDPDDFDSNDSTTIVAAPRSRRGAGNNATAADAPEASSTSTENAAAETVSGTSHDTEATDSTPSDRPGQETRTGDENVHTLSRATLSSAIAGPLVVLLAVSLGIAYWRRRRFLRCIRGDTFDTEKEDDVTDQTRSAVVKRPPMFANDKEVVESSGPRQEEFKSFGATEETSAQVSKDAKWLDLWPSHNAEQLRAPAALQSSYVKALRSHSKSVPILTTDSIWSCSDSQRRQAESDRSRHFAHELSTDGGVPTPKAYSGLD